MEKTLSLKLQPPEIYSHGNLNYKSDLFVVCCILFQILTGKYPFSSRVFETIKIGTIQQ